jgi:hypothetical protein
MRNKVEKLVIGGSAFVLVGVGTVFGLAMSGQAAEQQEPTVTVQPTETLPVVTVPAATPTVTAEAPAPVVSVEPPAASAPIVEPVNETPTPEPMVTFSSADGAPVPPPLRQDAGVPNPGITPPPAQIGDYTNVEHTAEPLASQS